MAKDPAVLFYTSDFITGTLMMTNEQRGKYIMLLCLQHQKGRLTERHMLSICKAYDKDIFEKFKKDNQGLYYNIRLEQEAIKRKKYTQSRRINAKGKGKAYAKDMDDHMEDENEDVIIDKKFKKPTIEEVKEYFDKWGYENAEKFFNYYETNEWKDSRGHKIKNWKQKAQGVWFKEENKKGNKYKLPKTTAL